MRYTPKQFEDGIVMLVDKPLGWTSFDVIRKLRPLIGIRKIGHAGTLDPLATGLLIVCTGKFTKRINQYMAQQKEYTGTITLGATTPTDDPIIPKRALPMMKPSIRGSPVVNVVCHVVGVIWWVTPKI